MTEESLMNQPNAAAPTGAYEALLSALADEQDALEGLLFKLKEQYHLLVSGEHRWIGRTSAEVSEALEVVAAASETRERAAHVVHAHLGLGVTTTLERVAERVPDEVVSQRIYQRRRSMRDVLDQVRRCTRQNRDLLAGGFAATGDALTLLGMTPTYDAAGATAAQIARHARVLDTRA
jgi:hypothetical protein